MNHTYMFIRLRRYVISLLFAIFVMILSFTALSNLNASIQRESTLLVHTLGEQKMLTQMMAKDATRISVLLSALHSENRVEPESVIWDKIAKARVNIQQSSDNFDNSLKTMQARYDKVYRGTATLELLVNKQQNQDLDTLQLLWQTYRSHLDVIISKGENDTAFRKSLIFINANDLTLLQLSEQITERLLHKASEDYKVFQVISILLVGTMTIFAVMTIYGLYRYLFKPLDELYLGFKSLGIAIPEYDVQTSKKENIKTALSEMRQLFEGMRHLMGLVENINTSISFNETLNYIYKTFMQFVPYTYIGIALFRDMGNDKLVASYGISNGFHKDLASELLGLAVDLEETSLGDIINTNKPRVINDLDAYFENRPIHNYSNILLKHGIKSSITLPLIVNAKHIGFIFFSSDKTDVYKPAHVDFLKTVSNAIAISLEKNIFVDDLVFSSVLALAKLAESKDEETGDHLLRMKRYVVLLTSLLMKNSLYSEEIDAEFLSNIEKFSPLHDIGKVGVPDHILQKPGKLTREEFDIMKTHPYFGAEVLRLAEENVNRSGRSMFAMGIDIAQSHHEKWDGSGYPNQLRGFEIPLSARIVALADVFDALLSKRPYKEAFDFDYSVEIILAGREKHFDPVILDAFAENIDQFRALYDEH